MSKHNSKESYNEDNLDFLSHLSKDTLKSKKAQKIDDICQSFNNTVMSPRTEIDVNNDNDKSQIDDFNLIEEENDENLSDVSEKLDIKSHNGQSINMMMKAHNLKSPERTAMGFKTGEEIIKHKILTKDELKSYQVEEKEFSDSEPHVPKPSVMSVFGPVGVVPPKQQKGKSKAKKKLRFVK